MPESSPISSQETVAIVRRHLDAFFRKDIDAMLDGYADDVTIFTPTGIVRGKATLRPYLNHYYAMLPAGALENFTVTRLDASGDVAHLLWRAADIVPYGGSTYVVRDGLIRVEASGAFQNHGSPREAQ